MPAILHPSFPRPTIQEAVLEIHFTRDQAWSNDLFTKFADAVRAQFPQFEPILALGVQVNVGVGAIGQMLLPPKQLLRFRHAERPVLVQLAEGLLAVNFLAPYPGWEEASRLIADSWKKTAVAVEPTNIATVALRYINLIPVAPSEPPAQWLAANRYLPEAILEAASGFYRADIRSESGLRTLITMMGGSIGTDVVSQRQGLILDIECSSDGALAPDFDALLPAIARLHESCWDVFNAGMTKRLRDYLGGGK